MEKLSFDGKVVVITGAGRGLGRSHALAFAERGALVVVNDIGAGVDGAPLPDSPALELVQMITDAGGTATADFNDVSSAESAAKIVAHAVDEFGRIDVVVNNAGILVDRSFPKMTSEDLQRVMNVHFYGSFYVSHAAWPHFKEQGSGRIINTTSVAGYLGNFGQANYGSAKAALIGLTRTLAIEGERSGIRVNAVAPGALTRMTESLIGDLGQRLDPGYVSPVVVMLAHDSCQLNGETLIAAGGRVARLIVSQNEGAFFSGTLTPEDLVANLDTVLDTSQPILVPNVAEEMGLLVAMLNR